MNGQLTMFGDVKQTMDMDQEEKLHAVNPDKHERFESWLKTKNGIAVWQAFMEISVTLKRRGKKRGAKYIIEGIRYRENISVDENGRRVDNNWAPFLARKVMEEIGEMRGYFELRDMKL